MRPLSWMMTNASTYNLVCRGRLRSATCEPEASRIRVGQRAGHTVAPTSGKRRQVLYLAEATIEVLANAGHALLTTSARLRRPTRCLLAAHWMSGRSQPESWLRAKEALDRVAPAPGIGTPIVLFRTWAPFGAALALDPPPGPHRFPQHSPERWPLPRCCSSSRHHPPSCAPSSFRAIPV